MKDDSQLIWEAYHPGTSQRSSGFGDQTNFKEPTSGNHINWDAEWQKIQSDARQQYVNALKERLVGHKIKISSLVNMSEHGGYGHDWRSHTITVKDVKWPLNGSDGPTIYNEDGSHFTTHPKYGIRVLN